MSINRFGTCFLLLTTIGSSAAIAAPSQNGVVATNAVTISQGDVIVSPMGLTQPMHIVIALKLRNQAQLNALIAKSGGGGTPLTPAQFEVQFSPTEAQAQQAAAFLIKAGFTNVAIAPNRLLVSGDGSVATVQAAFKTSMVDVHTRDGREAYANSRDVIVPSTLQDTVLSVLGLQTVHVLRTMHNDAQATNQSSVQPDTVTSHNPTAFAAIYDADTLPTASSVSVGIIAEGSLTNVLNDLDIFTTNNNLPPVTTQVIGNGGTDTSGDEEWDLDSQDIVGMSGGGAKADLLCDQLVVEREPDRRLQRSRNGGCRKDHQRVAGRM